MKVRASDFAKRAKADNVWATGVINSYILAQKQRVENGDISESRVSNYYKPIRLFCEENDVALNWKKIARRLPRGRHVANDRAPDIEEIKKILAYPDRRIKPACLIMESSGCRIGAFDYLSWGDLEPISKSGQKGPVVAARIRIYAGTNERYFSFITPEAFKSVKE